MGDRGVWLFAFDAISPRSASSARSARKWEGKSIKDEEGTYKNYIYNVAVDSIRLLTDPSSIGWGLLDQDPQFSSDSSSVVFTSNRPSSGNSPDVWTIPSLGETPTRLTFERSMARNGTSLFWSPDDQHIAYRRYWRNVYPIEGSDIVVIDKFGNEIGVFGNDLSSNNSVVDWTQAYVSPTDR